MRVLVTGGAGFVGSHVVVALLEAGHEVDVADDFSRGTPAALTQAERVTGRQISIHALDVADIDSMERLFAAARFDAVVHLAGLRSAADSLARPLDAYESNLTTTFTLLRCMAWYGVDRLVMSGSAAVYGPQHGRPVTERDVLRPTTPLGRTQATNEQLLTDHAATRPPLRAAVLRAFTTAGAHPSALLGEHAARSAASLLARTGQVALGLADRLDVGLAAGSAAEGAALHDYVHVVDVAAGHVAALEALDRIDQQVSTWNLGSGTATDVRQLLQTFAEVTGHDVPVRFVGGIDPTAAVVADASRAATDLGWVPARDLRQICADHWRWAQRHPRGYPLTMAPEAPWRGGVGHRLRLVDPALAPAR